MEDWALSQILGSRADMVVEEVVVMGEDHAAYGVLMRVVSIPGTYVCILVRP